MAGELRREEVGEEGVMEEESSGQPERWVAVRRQSGAVRVLGCSFAPGSPDMNQFTKARSADGVTAMLGTDTSTLFPRK